MKFKSCLLLFITLPLLFAGSQSTTRPGAPPNVALLNGRWFNGRSFEARTVYSVNGRFAFKRPAQVDRTLDLAGTWEVPPFAEAHNHNIGTGVEERDKKAIEKYIADGVLYVMIQGNLPMTEEMKQRLSINQPSSIDAIFAQGNITGSGGHPIGLVERILLPQGYFPGYTPQTLKDYRYFTVDSEQELDRKWPLILSHHPDFIKTILWLSDEFEKRKNDPAYFGQRGLDPRLLPRIVAKAHAAGLRESTHATDAADFHVAVTSGVDVIAHIPLLDVKPIAVEDARLAASRGIVVITTCRVVANIPTPRLPRSRLPQVLKAQAEDLKLLRDYGVPIAVGSDNVNDSSVEEVQYLQGLGVFDNLALLKMWTETTARSIFPKRKIGALSEGYEASFLALEGNPVENLDNVRRIKLRFKQGVLLQP